MIVSPFRAATLGLLALLTLAACSDYKELASHQSPLPPPVARPVSYAADVQPIIEHKCLACHGCYDAPCQLKLETAEGLLRGASPEPVYNGSRRQNMSPTRLGIDAHGEAAWREKGFHSVLEPTAEHEALLYRMIALGKQHPLPANARLPSRIDISPNRTHQCVTSDQFHKYERKHALEGMPFAVTGLSDAEFSILRAWFDQGATVSPRAVTATAAEQALAERWEAWLNQRSDRQQLVARWIYEHLFLAHLYLEERGADTHYYELIRSYTPPGEPIEPVATVRPNDDPEAPVFYRLQLLQEPIVHKRHITFRFDGDKLARSQQLFFGEAWQLEALPGYDAELRANPFETFAAIPARARYQFMLDEAEYFTRTFIRGPVCRGQIATDVIRDHFWTLFQHPDHDAYITDADYRALATPLLGMPGQNDRLLSMSSEWKHYLGLRNQYVVQRQDHYRDTVTDGAALDHVWDGDGDNHNALLTIARHHDSASVRRGLIGPEPRTIWWMDYPLFERTYYELVVNFDVFGNLAHQAQTRLYFDLIRHEAEENYLRLMPPGDRLPLQHSWYQGLGKLKLRITYAPLDAEAASAEPFRSDDPMTEMTLRLLDRFRDINAMPDDYLNRCQGAGCGRPDQPDWIRASDRLLSDIAAKHPDKVPGILHLPEVTFLRVHRPDGDRTVYTLVRNRAHSNVAFMMGESLRYLPEEDSVTVYPGIFGSYPNFMFDVAADELSEFVDRLRQAKDADPFEQIANRWGVRRTHPAFWEVLHDFTAWQSEHEPLQAGIFDINRFENL
ncbi:fatty acid cis/trans isomerase [Isoalcanivorax beigongshangi]|uniref:Fatty acid cis/trans isomerase n=1 Tax=Isoalcanivorax beigongshangi TaxID=3238810 RepID=A0ABV4AJ09_9GAMM